MDDSSAVVARIAATLAEHDGGFLRKDGDWQCRCGAVEVVSAYPGALARHQASVVAALPDIAIVPLSEPDEQVTDRRPGFSGLTFPAWHPHGIGDIGSAAVGQHPGIVEACWSGMTMWTPAEAEAVAAALLSAARAAGGQA